MIINQRSALQTDQLVAWAQEPLRSGEPWARASIAVNFACLKIKNDHKKTAKQSQRDKDPSNKLFWLEDNMLRHWKYGLKRRSRDCSLYGPEKDTMTGGLI